MSLLPLVQFTDVVSEVVFINPALVRCVRGTPNPKEVRIVFDKDHSVIVKSTVEKTLALLNGTQPPAVAASA